MRRIEEYQLWIGNARDARDVPGIRGANIRAIVDLAANERLLETVSRETMYLRIPLVDGSEDRLAVIGLAVGVVADLVRRDVPTLVFCSAGMSRSPAIIAGGLALAMGESPNAVLGRVIAGAPHDVSPALWDGVCKVVAERA